MTDFKSSTGRRLTQALFYEFGNKDAPYTLRDEDFTSRDGKTYASAARIYRESADEYEAAIKLFGSWSHWEFFFETTDWFLNGIDTGGFQFKGVKKWREEMALRDASISKKQLLKAAEEGNVTAQRYLNESATKKGKPGRPEKKAPQAKKSTVVELAKAMEARK